jgi:hypothetical protein
MIQSVLGCYTRDERVKVVHWRAFNTLYRDLFGQGQCINIVGKLMGMVIGHCSLRCHLHIMGSQNSMYHIQEGKLSYDIFCQCTVQHGWSWHVRKAASIKRVMALALKTGCKTGLTVLQVLEMSESFPVSVSLIAA